MLKWTQLLLLMSIVAALFEVRGVTSECCRLQRGGYIRRLWGGGVNLQCNDGTNQRKCCGVGDCNIFCCNCDGGCRSKKGSGIESRLIKRDLWDNVYSGRDADGSEFYDFNGAFQMAKSEYGNYTGSKEQFYSIFERLDEDKDGRLSPAELNNV